MARLRAVLAFALAAGLYISIGIWMPARAQIDLPTISPPATDSPQATIDSLFDEVERAFVIRAASDSSSIFELLGQRTHALIDLDDVPPELRIPKGVETALLLYEIIRRLPLPPRADIPDSATVREDELKQWTIPATGLTLIDTSGDIGPPNFRFAADSVETAPITYPILADQLRVRGTLAFDSVVVLRDGVGPWLTRLMGEGSGLVTPEWSRQRVLGVPLWKLALTLVMHLLAISAVIFVVLLLRRPGADGKRQQPLGSLPFVVAIIIMPLAAGLQYFVVAELRVTGQLLPILEALWVSIFSVGAIMLVFACMFVGANFFVRAAKLESRLSEALAVRLVFRLFALVIAFAILVNALDRLGVPVSGIVASLGVGGIAVALAAQGTLQNLFGGLSLLADRPIRIGDFCRFGEYLGTLESIGFRSCRIRTLSRTIVTVPNTEMAAMQIENYAVRDTILLRTRIGLRYQTTPDQLRAVVADLRAMLIAHPEVSSDPARARFIGFGDSALEIEIFAYVRADDYNVYMGIREDIMLRIMEIVERNGTEVAFPSRTLYLRRDLDPDAQKVQEAEDKVEQWRRDENLPFPFMDPTTAAELQDTLAYPPTGSVLRNQSSEP